MKERLKDVPLKPGVYIYKDDKGKIIYVGKAKALRNRMRSYFQSPGGLHPKVRAMMARVSDFDFIVTGTEIEALILENNLIKTHHPRYNIDLRDDKTYPFLKITTGEKYPGIYIVREKKDKNATYFGPYPNVFSLRDTVKVLTSIFPLRTCRSYRSRQRACLNRDIGKCLGPCTGQLDEREYGKTVNQLIRFMQGDSQGILKQKETAMQAAAQKLEFEKAADLRDQIRNIKKIQEKNKIKFETDYDLDLIGMVTGEKENLVLVFKIRQGKVIAKDTFWLAQRVNEGEAELISFFLKNYYTDNNDIPRELLVSRLPGEKELIEKWLNEQSGHKVTIKVPYRGNKKNILAMVLENARLLKEEKSRETAKNEELLIYLSKILGIEVVPERIECFDISHLAGQDTVGSMVVFKKAIPEKSAYRRFKIKDEQNNDYESLKEVLRRRFSEAQQGNPAFLPEPDLLLIDGGLGQVNSVKKVLDELDLDIPIFGLAEKNEEIYQPGISQPLILTPRDEGRKLLQRIRDEAHRFAITYNRQRRRQRMKKSLLDDIEGIGPQRKKTLLNHFGSVARIKKATRAELASLPGINKTVADNVYNYFEKSANEKGFLGE